MVGKYMAKRRTKGTRRIRVGPLQVILFALFLFLAIFELPRLWEGGLTLHAFDVGQGDAFLFRLPDGSTVMVDAGTRKAAADLVSKLRRLGVRRIDILVASHPHEDHIGGMTKVIESFEIGRFWDSGYNHGSSIQQTMLATIQEKGIRYGRPKAGFKEMIGDVTLEVLAPGETAITGTASDANNNGIVLLVTYGGVSFLMMGDVEYRGRQAIGRFPEAAVIKVSHHGARNGTDKKLLGEVAPRVAILSYGRGNSYGHPHKETMKLLEQGGVSIYATEDGDISLNTDGERLTVRQSRQ